ncbi:hypothetical protein D9Q98_010320 [Chlorella vulgaris]|uniref:Uncharacterized protein n=1 Tax=Chlorella vulgaris TaxID=3077 RepID=A0A9D4TJY7_CHLVU|nr:hypothetical protein D9Q98_010320 [Chlorella vulgaris]
MFAGSAAPRAAVGVRWQASAPPFGQLVGPKATAHERQQHQRRVWQPATTPHRTTVVAAAAAADGTGDELEMVMRGGKSVAVPPELAAGLAPLAAACSVVDVAAVARAVAALPLVRQQGVLDHGLAVAAYLQGLGIEQAQLGRLLRRCPELFSRPSEERAGVLFSQLMRLGLSAGQAADCFEMYPQAAGMPLFEAAVAVLAPLLAAGSKVAGRSGEQLLGDLLKQQPGGVQLLSSRSEVLQRNVDNLLQLGLSEEQQELGADRQLWVKVLHRAARVATCSKVTVRQRAQALVADFGKEETLRMQLGLMQLLVADKPAARQEWRQRQGRSCRQKAADDPVYMVVRDVAFPAPAKFACLVQDAEAWLSEDSELVGSSPSFEEFSKGLKQLPAWQRLWADAEAAVAELEQQLPPELLRAVDETAAVGAEDGTG